MCNLRVIMNNPWVVRALLSDARKLPSMVYRLHENDKYNCRIIEIEQGHFTPLILSTSGGMGQECAVFVKLLAKKIAQKKNQEQANVMRILRTEL